MKKMTKRKTVLLLCIGMFVIATSQISFQYVALNDLVRGAFMGIGIGLLLTAMILGSFKTSQ